MYRQCIFTSSAGDTYNVVFVLNEKKTYLTYVHIGVLEELLPWTRFETEDRAANYDRVEWTEICDDVSEGEGGGEYKYERAYFLLYKDFMTLLNDYCDKFPILNEFIPWMKEIHDKRMVNEEICDCQSSGVDTNESDNTKVEEPVGLPNNEE